MFISGFASSTSTHETIPQAETPKTLAKQHRLSLSNLAHCKSARSTKSAFSTAPSATHMDSTGSSVLSWSGSDRLIDGLTTTRTHTSLTHRFCVLLRFFIALRLQRNTQTRVVSYPAPHEGVLLLADASIGRQPLSRHTTGVLIGFLRGFLNPWVLIGSLKTETVSTTLQKPVPVLLSHLLYKGYPINCRPLGGNFSVSSHVNHDLVLAQQVCQACCSH